ncbi:hypothetical protein [Flavobacterium commune]|uniref:hypothetical protein n=1 Tax=Flavobacterium commune TaxID=1306519 RepID=UPI0012F76C0D|nr:hypothetical protein [Flavobacterium commune]
MARIKNSTNNYWSSPKDIIANVKFCSNPLLQSKGSLYLGHERPYQAVRSL